MRVTLDRRTHLAADDAVERAMQRYNAASAVYDGLVGRNSRLTLSGGRPSTLARIAEERAFEELDSARHALFTAAADAFPTIH